MSALASRLYLRIWLAVVAAVVLLTLAALETVLSAEGHRFTRGAGVDAAWQVWREAKNKS